MNGCQGLCGVLVVPYSVYCMLYLMTSVTLMFTKMRGCREFNIQSKRNYSHNSIKDYFNQLNEIAYINHKTIKIEINKN